jgi:hypothetical protein
MRPKSVVLVYVYIHTSFNKLLLLFPLKNALVPFAPSFTDEVISLLIPRDPCQLLPKPL